MPTFFCPRRLLAVACVAVTFGPLSARLSAAQTTAHNAPTTQTAAPDADVTLACLAQDAQPDAPCGQAQAGVVRWLWEVHRRTSVAVRPVPVAATWTPHPPAEPLALWLGSTGFAPLAPQARANLVNFLRSGGTLLVDASDARTDSPFVAAVRRTLEAAFGPDSVVPVPPNHVLFKSFYLVAGVGGRAEEAAAPGSLANQLEGLFVGGRLAVLLLHHDLFGSLAQLPSGAFVQPAGPRGERGREMDLRWGINWLMLALCGDYKNDHVHLPFILKRRQ